MNREILFRGIRGDGGGWAEGWYINGVIHAHNQSGGALGENSDGSISIGMDVWKVIPETVGQYIRTINGQRLFNGDMFIHVNHPETTHKVEIIDGEAVVFARGETTGWIRDNRSSLSVYAKAWEDTFKIIGTIHDHLLEDNP